MPHRKHLPFDSTCARPFEVVEEWRGNMRLYPHTEQLPRLLQSLNSEFYLHLPARLARADRRADGFTKLVLADCATAFCHTVNYSRRDQLQTFALLDDDLVAHVAVVQQITEEDPRGPSHRFHFYTGHDFSADIYLSGRRVSFADHVIERFSERVPNRIGGNMSNFLFSFYSRPLVSMAVNGGRAFVISYYDSILAVTFKETEQEYFATTCLGVKQIRSLDKAAFWKFHHLHYRRDFAEPKVGNYDHSGYVDSLYRLWQDRTPPRLSPLQTDNAHWPELAAKMKDLVQLRGHGPGSGVCFPDGVPGPCYMEMLPGIEEVG